MIVTICCFASEGLMTRKHNRTKKIRLSLLGKRPNPNVTAIEDMNSDLMDTMKHATQLLRILSTYRFYGFNFENFVDMMVDAGLGVAGKWACVDFLCSTSHQYQC